MRNLKKNSRKNKIKTVVISNWKCTRDKRVRAWNTQKVLDRNVKCKCYKREITNIIFKWDVVA